MSRDDLRTITSSSAASTDDNFTAVTGTDVGSDPTKKRALDVALVAGTVTTTPGGGGISSLVTTIITTVNDATWTALPTVNAVGRAGFSIQNQSGFQIKINGATPAGYDGVIVENGGERFYDANDSATINAKSTPGSGTVTPIVIEEVIP